MEDYAPDNIIFQASSENLFTDVLGVVSITFSPEVGTDNLVGLYRFVLEYRHKEMPYQNLGFYDDTFFHFLGIDQTTT